jgi:hypothetical protein
VRISRQDYNINLFPEKLLTLSDEDAEFLQEQMDKKKSHQNKSIDKNTITSPPLSSSMKPLEKGSFSVPNGSQNPQKGLVGYNADYYVLSENLMQNWGYPIAVTMVTKVVKVVDINGVEKKLEVEERIEMEVENKIEEKNKVEMKVDAEVEVEAEISERPLKKRCDSADLTERKKVVVIDNNDNDDKKVDIDSSIDDNNDSSSNCNDVDIRDIIPTGVIVGDVPSLFETASVFQIQDQQHQLSSSSSYPTYTVQIQATNDKATRTPVLTGYRLELKE